MARTKNTDDAVMELLRKVEVKKAEITKASKRPQWKTNLTIGYDPESTAGRLNIMTVRKIEKIVELYAFLLQKEALLKQANAELGASVDISYMGYSITDWKEDLRTRADQLGIEQKKRELDELDRRVNKLVSPEQRREMELKALKEILGE